MNNKIKSKLFYELFKNIGEEEYYCKNEIIHLDGIKGDCVWFIKKGKVKHVFHDMEGYEKTVLILSENDIFGEITLFQCDKNMVLTQAIEDTIVNKIDRDLFLEIITKYPDNLLNLIEVITGKFRIVLHQMKDLSFKNIEGRLANLLLRLTEQQGIVEEDGVKIDLFLTHNELANMVAATRASITRAINKFKKDKLIKIENKKIVVLNKQVLRNYDNNKL